MASHRLLLLCHVFVVVASARCFCLRTKPCRGSVINPTVHARAYLFLLPLLSSVICVAPFFLPLFPSPPLSRLLSSLSLSALPYFSVCVCVCAHAYFPCLHRSPSLSPYSFTFDLVFSVPCTLAPPSPNVVFACLLLLLLEPLSLARTPSSTALCLQFCASLLPFS